MSKCLVTGGAGFIGSHLVRRLLADGWTVRVLDDLSTGYRHNVDEVAQQIEFVEGSICDEAVVKRSVAGVDVIFHLAAQVSVPRSVDKPREAHLINGTGMLNVLLAARDAGIPRLVFSASSAAYGETPTLPKIETMPPSPLSPYAATKVLGEYYCRNFAQLYGMQTVSLRYFNVFGVRQDPKSAYAAAIPAFVTRMVRGERPIVFGDGEQSRDFCYVDNVVQANLLSAKAPKLAGEVVNIACGERITVNAILARINAELGTQIKPDYQPPRKGDVKHSLADISAARKLLGYEPQVMFAEGLSRAVQYYKSLK